MSELNDRITAAEEAVKALGRHEFGDSEGHPFRGNQYSDGGGRSVGDQVRYSGDVHTITAITDGKSGKLAHLRDRDGNEKIAKLDAVKDVGKGQAGLNRAVDILSKDPGATRAAMDKLKAEDEKPASDTRDAQLEKVRVDVDADGPPPHVLDAEEWRNGVANGADYLRDGGFDEPWELQDYARGQLDAIGEEDMEMVDTRGPSGRELADPESYYEGLLSYADAAADADAAEDF